MKPLKLTMQAFGAFAAPQTVDFTLLGEQALFLIHGPTGAGKTTLLDALCFALYGDTSGGEREPRAMRSDHAPQTLATEVTLEFALGCERFRVTRQPAQRRPKQRGAGFREVPPTAQLDQFAQGAWRSLASQPAKVNAAVKTRLGFDSAQFRQVIVLPQGRFRELLTARSDEREAILQTLFRTEAYRVLTDELKREAKALEEHARTLTMKRAAVLQSVAQESIEALVAHRAETEDERARLGDAEAPLRVAAVRAREALEQGRSAKAALAELAAARHAEEALLARQAVIDGVQRELDEGRRAEQVRPLDQALSAACETRDAAQARTAQVRKTLAEALRLSENAKDAHAAQLRLAPEREALARRQAELDALVDKVDALVRAREQRDAERARLADGRRALENNRAECTRRKATRAEQGARREGLREQAAQIEVLQHRMRDAQARQKRLERLAQSQREHDEAARRYRDGDAAFQHADQACARARKDLETFENEWFAAQAGVLAAALVPGQPCPVCGGADHPQPARSPAADAREMSDAALRATREAVRQATERREAAAHARHQADKEYANMRTLVAELKSVASEASSEGAEETLAALAARLERAHAASAEVQRIGLALEENDRALAATEQACERAESDCNAISARIAACDAEVRLLEQAVPDVLRAPGALRAEISAVAKQRTASDAALATTAAEAQATATRYAQAQASEHSALAELERATVAVETARVRLVSSYSDAGFASEAAYRAALRAPPALEQLGRDVAAHREACAAARDRLARALATGHGLAEPDLDALAKVAHEAAAELEKRVLALQALAARIAADDRALVELNALTAHSDEIHKRYAVLGRLAEVSGGANALRMTFQRFVLATLLDEVLEAASMRLTRMSRNRFELRRVCGVLDQRSAGGLELEVFDHYTGTLRPANTLSGGEGFLASLSLALGLADVVQSRAGGIQMETLFIDEGFGTLDPESLDFALRTLIDLQQAGRMVGVISHVAELRERMDVRVEVKVGAAGSVVAIAR